MKLPEKWPRGKALKIREIIERLRLCPCGSTAQWDCILELLSEAETHTDRGFYRDKWFEFGAKVLGSWDLIDHGTGIGFAWLSDDGRLLLEFLRDFGVEDYCMDDGSGTHPLWSIELDWDETQNDTDAYAEWAAKEVPDEA